MKLKLYRAECGKVSTLGTLTNNGEHQWRPVVGYEGFYEVSSYGAARRSGNVKATNNLGARQTDIAKAYGVKPPCVAKIIKGRTWSHV